MKRRGRADPTLLRRPALSLLHESEVTECMKRAYEELPPEQKAAVRRYVNRTMLGFARNFGFWSVLRTLLVTDEEIAQGLDDLDAEVLEAQT